MRERRWETKTPLTFDQVHAVRERLAALGLKPAIPARDVICYIEEWRVESLQNFNQLEAWSTEDVTLIHVLKGWHGDFFLLAGAYHTKYQRYQDVGTYCSISHPWRVRDPLRFHDPRSMLWLGFRNTHSFIRVRLQTKEVITPNETRGDVDGPQWLEERRMAFLEAITLLELSVETSIERQQLVLRSTDSTIPFFCSWPDAFGPCQFEFNTPDTYEFLVPASRLAATSASEPATVRVYLTGFSEDELIDFQGIAPTACFVYRCSVHCPLEDLPKIQSIINPDGHLYSTLCEFQTQELLPDEADASAIIGIVGNEAGFYIEARLNLAPLADDLMSPWLEKLIGHTVRYAPLPAFV